MKNTADIVVIGGGPAGMATALEASKNGASVLLLEADTLLGGNAARSTGYLAFQGFEMQHREGLDDNAEIFFKDMVNEIKRQEETYGIEFDAELAKVFAKESATTYDWLVELGFEFNRFLPRPLQHSVNRMVDVTDTSMFTKVFSDVLEMNDVDVRTSTRARRLLLEDNQIVGVQTDKESFRANMGVVLAAGGYQANSSLRKKYQPEHMATTPYLGTHHDVGDGHIMGQEVGGELINMTMIPPLIMVGSALVEDSIAVNTLGRRFHDEAGPYDYRVQELNKQPNKTAYYIYDNQTYLKKRQLINEMPQTPSSANSLMELAQTIGSDHKALEEAVTRWNDFLTSSEKKDPDFGRVILPAERRAILEPPYFASKMITGINFPAGGFRVNADLQVLNVYGEPIPKLFAVGDCSGGLGPVIGMGGMRITPALTLGRVVGRKIATQKFECIPNSERLDEYIPSNTMKVPVIDD
ncbi:MAG: FAD-dependent oxidoreductase [Actinomycetota bacterium]|nr:FAD-dependent oxidoreductase [Actinomycetota bacterium]